MCKPEQQGLSKAAMEQAGRRNFLKDLADLLDELMNMLGGGGATVTPPWYDPNNPPNET